LLTAGLLADGAGPTVLTDHKQAPSKDPIGCSTCWNKPCYLYQQ